MLRSFALTFTLVLAPALADAAPLPVAPKPRPAPASRPTTRQSVEKLLRATERPPAPADLAGIGAGAEDALVAVAGDRAAEPTLRGRATGALAHAASPRARSFLLDVVARGAAADPAAATPAASAGDRLVLRRAAVALGWQGGPAAPPALGALLAHADPEVRTDAALGLGLTRLAPAATLLRNHLAVEKDAKVRAHVARQLSAIETSLGLDEARRPAPTPEPETRPAEAAPAASATDLPRAGHAAAAPPHPNPPAFPRTAPGSSSNTRPPGKDSAC